MSGASVKLAMTLIGTDYRFERKLGVGGNGIVILARHLPLDRLVAVKTILTTGAAGPDHARLRREGRALAALGHPNILEVYRLIDDGAAIALVTEYVPGGDLDGALRQRNLFGARIVGVLCQVADALVAAHGVGIVHRDIKPANVLIGDGATGGRAVVADFGLARLRGEFRTEDGLVTGTPVYMSPEQIDQPDVERPSMDVYSYTVMSYRALTGQVPFQTSNLAELIAAHRHITPEWPGALRPDLPVVVSDLLMAGLAKNPNDRAGLVEIAAALRGIDADVWDAILPEPQRPAVAPAVQASGAADGTGALASPGGDATVTAAGGTGEMPMYSDDPHSRPVVSSIAEVQSIEPTLFIPRVSKRKRRWHIRLIALVVGLLVGLAIGLLALALI